MNIIETSQGAPSLSVIETTILSQLSDGSSKGSVADTLGIPTGAIVQLLRRKGVKEWLQELKVARKEAMLSYATEVVAATLRDKMEIIADDDDKRLGTSTRKDHIELAKTLTDMLKGPVAAENSSNDPLAAIYNKLGAINANNVQINIDSEKD